MAFSDYSATPANNSTIEGINIAEGCPAANVNNALRQLAADGRALSDQVNGISLSSYMLKSGGAFTGPITYSGAGSYCYWASGSLTSGAKYVQPVSAALPSSPAEGMTVFQY